MADGSMRKSKRTCGSSDSVGKWPLVPIGEIADLYDAPHQTAPLDPDGPFIYLNVGDIRGGRIALSLSGRVSESTAAEWTRRVQPRPGDVVFGYEAKVGEAAMLTGDHRWCLGRRVGLLRPDPDRLDPRYLSYAWYSKHFQATLRAHRIGGTTIESIRLMDLPRWPIALPPLAEQRRIAGILGALDDKIELNRRTSETLQAIARTLFKSWFGTGGTRAEGRWRQSVIADEFKVTMGQSPPGSTYNSTGDGLPFYQGRADFGPRFPTRRVYCTAPTRTAAAGDTLLSVRAPVGDINIATETCAIGRGVAAIRHRSGSRTFTFEFMGEMRAVLDEYNAHGTVFGAIGGKDLLAIPCLAPPDGLVREYEERARPLDERLENLERQRQTLTETRDAMLPRLVSGEMSLSSGNAQGV
jgi:type I restriction enzyme S subunit